MLCLKKVFKSLVVVLLCAAMLVPCFKSYAAGEKNIIPIAMATDDNYVYPTLVAMTSMLENKNPDTCLKYYIMLSGTLSAENKGRLKNIEKYYEGCTVELIDMKDKFSSAYLGPISRLTVPMYYRLCLPSVLSDCDKVLYMDGDVVVRHDLWKLYSTDISGYYVGAVREFQTDGYAKSLGMDDANKYVNSGVLLMNLKSMRDEHVEERFNEFIPKLKEKGLLFPDQDALNAVCYNKIKFLDLEYNTMQQLYFNYEYLALTLDWYHEEALKRACVDPTIFHYTGRYKPWKVSCVRFYCDWDKYRKMVESRLYKRLSDGTYKILSAIGSNKAIDICGSSKENLANVQLWSANNTDAQKFRLKYIQAGYYKMEAVCSGKVLDVYNEGKTKGTNVVQFQNNGGDGQNWYLKDAGGGYFYIISMYNGLYLDVHDSENKNGANIWLWDFNGGNAQKFKLIKY